MKDIPGWCEFRLARYVYIYFLRFVFVERKVYGFCFDVEVWRKIKGSIFFCSFYSILACCFFFLLVIGFTGIITCVTSSTQKEITLWNNTQKLLLIISKLILEHKEDLQINNIKSRHLFKYTSNAFII